MLFFDVSGEADPCAVAETWMHEDMARVVDLTHGYALFRAATNLFFWYARYHHICNDGFGFSWVARRLAAVFSALIGDKPLETGNYGSWFDLLDEEDEYRLSARYVHAREYWHNQLAQRPEPVTLSGILGMHVTGRSGARMHGTVGMISNVLLLRVVIDLKNSFDLLQQVSWRMRQCLRHQRYRAELHAEELGLYGTIVNIMPFDYDLRFAGYPSHAHNLSLGPVTELAIAVYDRRDGSNPEDRLRREPSELHRRGACLAPAAFLGHARSTAYGARSVAATAGNP